MGAPVLMGVVPTEAEALPEDAVVLRRPQYARSGRELFFLISRRPQVTLTDPECTVWDAMAEAPTMRQVRIQCGPSADGSVRRLLAVGVCEIASRFPEGRRRVAVIEPHIDDAALSVGGAMWSRRHECEFEVFTLGSRSNFTSYFQLAREFFDRARVTALRKAEGELSMRLVGGRHVAMGFPEALLRYHDADWTLDWYLRHRHSVAAATAHRSGEGELRLWTDAIRSLFRGLGADEVWIPLGMGAHSDHELARNACLTALIEEPSLLEGRTFHLYQEVPYAAREPGFTEELIARLTRAGARLQREPMAMNEATYAAKLRLLEVFGSQFKVGALREGIDESARLAAGGAGRAELLWQLIRLPDRLDPVSFYSGASIVESAVVRLSRWVEQHRRARRIRLLMLVPSGRWRDDLESLLRIFPRAELEVYLTSAAEAEVRDVPSPRVQLRVVERGSRAWGGLALNLALRRPAPTVFLAGFKRLGLARWLARLWPMSDPVILPTLDHFVTALGVVERR